MITRRIGRLLRGKATPAQLMMACILGSMLGFMPGFQQAPGMMISLIFLLIILNANLFLAGVSALLAMFIALLAIPVTFQVGRLLLDGPLAGLFGFLINAPVTALFGFEYYLTTGGMVMGLLVGIVIGVLVVRAITAFRKKMSQLEQGSERYKTLTSKWYIKLFTFIFVGGGHGKLTYDDLLQRKIGNPIRVLGVIAVALLIVLLVIVQQFAAGPIVMAALKQGVERANGATVDIQTAELNLREGRLVITGLAMADANDLSADLLRADRLEGDISATDLLRKRIALDQITLVNATTGEKRTVPGRLVGRTTQPSKDDPGITLPDEKTLGDYIEQAEAWKERLARVRDWLETLSGTDENAEADAAKRSESLRERLRREIREHGYARVRADHHIKGAPTFAIHRLDAEKVRAAKLEGTTLDIRGRNLSTHPHLNEAAPTLLITSSDDRLLLDLSLAHALPGGGASSLKFHYRGLATDDFAKHLSVAGAKPLQGGTIDVATEGTYAAGGWINLPLTTTLHNVNLSVAGSNARKIDRLTVPIGVRGPIDQPRITLDDKALADALVKAGASELAGRLNEKVGGKLDDKLDDLGDKLPGGLRDTIRDGAGGLLPRRNQ